MFVGEQRQVIRLDGSRFARRTVVIPDLPAGGHWTREIVLGPDGLLYLSVGSSCNVCEERDPRRAAVSRYRADGSGGTVIVRGLRNAASLAVHPGTGAIWASQNERDGAGDDIPPEEINILSDGTDFGWPYCYGQRIPNAEYRDPARCAATTPPALEMQAHSAPLGMTFYTGEQFPESGAAICSWRSTAPGTGRARRATSWPTWTCATAARSRTRRSRKAGWARTAT